MPANRGEDSGAEADLVVRGVVAVAEGSVAAEDLAGGALTSIARMGRYTTASVIRL